MKTKSPAFQFYPADYLSDMNTIAFTAEQDGHYLRLLCICWLEGFIPAEHDKVRRLLKDGDTIDQQALIDVLSCFKLNMVSKTYSHSRLDKERKKQFEWRKKSSAGGKASALIKRTLNGGNGASRVVEPKGNTMSSSSSMSMSSGQKSVEPKKAHTLSFDSWDMQQAQNLYEHCLKLVPSTKKPKMEVWANEFRLMRKEDKRSKECVHEIICWMHHDDDFWGGQIRSPKKLRKHYETMYAKRNSKMRKNF